MERGRFDDIARSSHTHAQSPAGGPRARDLWLLPGAETRAPEALAELNLRFPSDLAEVELKSAAGRRPKLSPGRPGQSYTDAWGCTWQVGPHGELGALQHAPLAEAEGIADYQPPAEGLEAGKFAAACRSCAGSTRFTLAHSDVQPLARMQALRGPDNALADSQQRQERGPDAVGPA